MRDLKFILCVSSLIFSLISLLGILRNNEDILLDKQESIMSNSLNSFQENLIDYYEYVNVLENLNGERVNDLRERTSQLRLAYKNCELYFEYFDPQLVKMKINGAPLPKLEPKVPENRVFPPSGLQRIDELVYEDEIDLDELKGLTKKLFSACNVAIPILRSKRIQHRYILEAARQNILRSYTLGLTGFDTPGSVLAIPESLQNLKALDNIISVYEKF